MPLTPAEIARQITERAAGLTLYARQWLDAASAEDVLQEALASLLAQRPPPDDPVAWTCRVIRNAAIDHARSTSRRRRRERVVAESRPERFEATPESLIDARTAEGALARLPESAREVILLRIWADLSFVQIAATLGLSVSTVHNRYTDALDELRAILETPCRTNLS